MPLLIARRRRRLRDELAPRRRSVETATGAALRAQQRQLTTDPERQASTAAFDRAVRELRALARELDRRAGRDAQVRAAARGVGELARAYAALAAAGRSDDPQAGADATTKAVAALRAAEQLERKAGDAWPL